MQITLLASKMNLLIILLIFLSGNVVAKSKYIISADNDGINIFDSSGLVSKIPAPLIKDTVDSNFIVLVNELNKINNEYYFAVF